MSVTFPDPDTLGDEKTFSYTTDNGAVIQYKWDGEKWVSVDIGGVNAGAATTRELLLVNAITNPFSDLPDLDTLATQEDYNQYLYSALESLYEGIDAGEYSL